MGEVVSFAAYRLRDAAKLATAADVVADPSDIRHACGDFLVGLDRMKSAARMLSKASSELRELARER